MATVHNIKQTGEKYWQKSCFRQRFTGRAIDPMQGYDLQQNSSHSARLSPVQYSLNSAELWPITPVIRQRFCTARLYWAGDDLGWWNELYYEPYPDAGSISRPVDQIPSVLLLSHICPRTQMWHFTSKRKCCLTTLLTIWDIRVMRYILCYEMKIAWHERKKERAHQKSTKSKLNWIRQSSKWIF